MNNLSFGFSLSIRPAGPAPAQALRRAAGVALVLALLLVGGAPVLAPAPAQAQVGPPGGAEGGQDAYVNRYARPGRATMTVYLWGEVGNTGIWRVERDVDLVELLSAAQVPGVGTEQPDFTERVMLTVYRGAPNERRQVYRAQLEDLVAESGQYPTLQNEDILQIQVQQEQRFNFQNVLGYVSTAASLVLLALRIFDQR